ncbi:glycerophosphodiester phosphodiesterase [Clostridium sp. SY8519]|uniref:glycerophosphodiester phosphodiesterase n=1 Tax=Clostridium sp. (strain SY8519) TaxID=1042156 RepID=UPI0002F4B81A|nr:glycerophosphodiester phosphodiesterase [Clostridium sp. SY8519]
MTDIKQNLRQIREYWNYGKKNMGTLLIFEVIYKLALILVAKPCINGLIHLAMYLRGLTFISDETLFELLRSPWTILLLAVFCLLLTFLVLFDICCIIKCFHATYHRQQIPLTALAMEGLRAATGHLFQRSILLIVYLLVIIPLTYSAVMSGYVAVWSVPHFIMEYIDSKPMLRIAYVGGMIFLAWKFFPWVYALHIYTLDHVNFKTARKQSKRLVSGHYWMDLIFLAGWCILLLLAYYGIILLGGWVISSVNHLLASSDLFSSLTLSGFAVLLNVVGVVYYCMALPMVFLGVSIRYYSRKEQNGETAAPAFRDLEHCYHISEAAWVQKIVEYRKRILVAVLAALIGTFTFLSVADKKGWVRMNVQTATQVTAHRGYSAQYPENTIPAFLGAARIGADFAELDVQQTADGELVVMHDASLKRTTGWNKKVWECTAAQISRLDAGSWFGSRYKGTAVPTLEEVIRATKGKIRLNIETKPSEHDTDLEEKLTALIKKYHLEKSCVVSSLKYSSIKKVKQLDPDITTAYISSISYGNFSDMLYADAYSVESSGVTAQFVHRIHRAGKQVYVWTVDDESTMKEMVELGADQIITNEPVEAEKLIIQDKHMNFWDHYLDDLMELGK